MERGNISKSSTTEVRYFRDCWKIRFPWVLRGQTDTSDLTCSYCDYCDYSCNLKVKKNSLELHEKTKKHKQAELVVKENNLFIEPERLDTQSMQGSITRQKDLRRKVIKKEKNVEIDRVIENEIPAFPDGNDEPNFSSDEEAGKDDYSLGSITRQKDLRRKVIKKEKNVEIDRVIENEILAFPEGNEQNFLSDEEARKDDYSLGDIITKVTNSFANDVMQLLKRDANLRGEAMKRKQKLKKREKEVDHVTKLVVGQLAHNYLTDNVQRQWETDCPSYNTISIVSRASEIERQLKQSTDELQKIQSHSIFAETRSLPAGQILIEALDYDIQEEPTSSSMFEIK